MSDQQKEIENELLKIYDKNLDRYFLLTKFIFLIFGIYTLILSNIYGKLDRQAFDNAETISAYSLLACLLVVSITLIFPFSQLLLPKEQKFKQIGDSIQFREENEVKIYNKKLYLTVRQQESYYIISFLLILLSFIFFCGHFIPCVICISVPILIISIFYYLSFSEWIKRENREVKNVQRQEEQISN